MSCISSSIAAVNDGLASLVPCTPHISGVTYMSKVTDYSLLDLVKRIVEYPTHDFVRPCTYALEFCEREPRREMFDCARRLNTRYSGRTDSDSRNGNRSTIHSPGFPTMANNSMTSLANFAISESWPMSSPYAIWSPIAPAVLQKRVCMMYRH